MRPKSPPLHFHQIPCHDFEPELSIFVVVAVVLFAFVVVAVAVVVVAECILLYEGKIDIMHCSKSRFSTISGAMYYIRVNDSFHTGRLKQIKRLEYTPPLSLPLSVSVSLSLSLSLSLSRVYIGWTV